MSKQALTYSSRITIDDSTKTLLVIGGVAVVGLMAWVYSKNATAPISDSLASTPTVPDTTPTVNV